MPTEFFTNPNRLETAPRDWQIQSVESLCLRVTSGGTPSRRNPAYYENGTIPWLKTQELKDWYIDDSEEKITQEALENSSAKIFPQKTVLMAMYGDGRTITSLGILRKEAATNQACCALIPNPAVCDHLFLLYALKHHRNDFIHLASGGSQRNLNAGLIRNFALKVPPLPTQRRIASILSAYDDLIENNTRRIKILEQMAQAIYREWFVEFRAPGVKLRQATPEEQKVTGKDRFPVGWEVGRLDDALVLQRGFDLPKGQRQEGNVPIYAATGIVGTHDEAKVKGPGVVTGRSGSLGTVLYIEEDYWPLNTALWVKEFRRSTPIMAYYLLSSLELGSFNSGAAVPTLNRNDIHGLPVVLSTEDTLQQFDDQLRPMFAFKRCLTEKNANLRQTRDLLLPRLVGGEIAVNGL